MHFYPVIALMHASTLHTVLIEKKKTKSQTIYNLSVSNIPYYDSDLFSIF